METVNTMHTVGTVSPPIPQFRPDQMTCLFWKFPSILTVLGRWKKKKLSESFEKAIWSSCHYNIEIEHVTTTYMFFPTFWGNSRDKQTPCLINNCLDINRVTMPPTPSIAFKNMAIPWIPWIPSIPLTASDDNLFEVCNPRDHTVQANINDK